MKKFVLMILSIIVIVSFTGCTTQKYASETPDTIPPSIMAGGEIYSTTGEKIPIEPDEGVIMTLTSVINGTELPSNEGEINFSVSDTKYAKINDDKGYVIVLIDSEWVKFVKENDR